MKYVNLPLLFLLSAICAYGQSSYNYRLTFDRPVPTVLTSIEVNDSCYYVCGITNDTLPPYQLGVLFAKMSFEGEVLWYKVLVDPYKYISAWRNNLSPTIDGNFLVSDLYSDTLIGGISLIKFTPLGDTLFLKIFPNPYFPEETFVASLDLHEESEENIYILGNIQSPNDNTQFVLLHTDGEGELLWQKIYGTNQWSDSGHSILSSEGALVLGGGQGNENFATSNYVNRAMLTKVNLEGEVEWEYLSPEGELLGRIYDVIQSDDGGYVAASGKGVELADGPNAYMSWNNYLFKLDADRNFEWGVDMTRDTFIAINRFTKVIAVSDNSGYVVVGTVYSPDFVKNGWDFFGSITKISKEGDSLWTRYYQHVESVADDHIFYDVEESPDGGFVMVGQATDFYTLAESPLQRAWIVKTDEHGCVVPGCHLVSSTIDLHKDSFQLKLYPNPVSASSGGYLNAYFYHPDLKGEAVFQLTDVSGKVLLSFKSNLGDVTHMVPVSNLASGLYWLTCRVGDTVLTEAVVVE